MFYLASAVFTTTVLMLALFALVLKRAVWPALREGYWGRLEIAEAAVTALHPIGEGSWAVVYRGVYQVRVPSQTCYVASSVPKTLKPTLNIHLFVLKKNRVGRWR